MRLIDADELIKEIEQSKNDNPHKNIHVKRSHDIEHDHFIKMVTQQNTAFDKEKVIEELQDAGQSCHEDNDTYGVEAIEYAIEIVEKGGIE